MSKTYHTPKPLTPEQRDELERIKQTIRGLIVLIDRFIEERVEPDEVAAAYYEAGFHAGKAAAEDES